MSDEDCYRRLNPCKAAKEVARLAITALGDQVGERSAKHRLKTRFSIARLGVPESVIRLQVPPRPPKRQSKGCLFFCQLILAKTVKTPNFPVKNGELGAFCIPWAILAYLQLFLPIFLKRVGAVAAPGGDHRSDLCLDPHSIRRILTITAICAAILSFDAKSVIQR